MPAMPGPLLTDLYQLTMAYGYWKSGRAEREACFALTYRTNPFGGGFALACGLASAVEFLQGFRFGEEDLGYLESLRADDGTPMFEPGFLDELAALRFACDVHAMPEGTVAFPHEPLVRVSGPILHAQLVETALLCLVNFQTLIATKAARVSLAAGGDAVLEFGLRRAQGVDGGLSAARATYVGGVAATSNVLAGRRFKIPVKGTHAHSWVMSFDTEEEAFDAYARAMPHNSILLVDTYDTLEGVRRAVETGKRLREAGHRLAGIRLDSGDLLELSRASRRILDEAGFSDAAIVASGDLDEYRIAELKAQGAPIGIWGVGTKLATAYEEPALGGVYKLTAIRDEHGAWKRKLKTTDDPEKESNPGVLQVSRFTKDGRFVRDVLYDRELATPGGGDDLLVPVFARGDLVGDVPGVAEARARAARQLAALPDDVRRLEDPARYPVELEPGLAALKEELRAQAGGSK